MDRQTRKDD